MVWTQVGLPADAVVARFIVVPFLHPVNAANGSLPFRPYFESGFPHGHDQWISAAATNWAAMALVAAAGP